MKVWVIHVDGGGNGNVQVFATKARAIARMEEGREEDWRSLLDNYDSVEQANEDRENGNLDDWNEWDNVRSSGYAYDSGDDGWIYVTVRECEVQGLAGRNAL